MQGAKRNLSFYDLTGNSLEDLQQSIEILKDINSYNPFLSTSSDTDWIDKLYKEVFPLAGSLKHKQTFISIIINLAMRKSTIAINLASRYYKDIGKPEYLLPSAISDICNSLEKKGYCRILKGFKPKGKNGIPTELSPTDQLIQLIPNDYRCKIAKEGLIQVKGFSPDIMPEDILQTRELLERYNKTVEPENMLYATFKDGFNVNGRFHGSKVIVMPKDERKNIKIDGEETVEIDIQNCIPFLLSASELGKGLPGDIYTQPNVPRKIMKIALLIALNCASKKSAKGALQGVLSSSGTDLKSGEILDTLSNTYPALALYFYTSIGTKMMRIESRCMEKFMGKMLDLGIKHYPIYDSVRVPISKKDIAIEELKKAFTVSGVEPVIHEE